jgi:hypothetical protein
MAPDLDPVLAFGAAGAEYEVTIENLTAAQAFTPPLIATHRASTHMFRVGEPASTGIQQIAENGNLDPMLATLESDRHVWAHVVAVAGDIPPLLGGESVTVHIRAGLGATRLSWASMLICTNDGFTGSSGVRLPQHVGDTEVLLTNGYDAGTEMNTEDFADLVPPCGPLSGVDSGGQGTGMSDPGLAEGGVIQHHAGIQGITDLNPAIHGWTDPVARVTIRRVE